MKKFMAQLLDLYAVAEKNKHHSATSQYLLNPNAQMAEELVISIETVKTHVHNILNKLDLKTRRQIMKK